MHDRPFFTQKAKITLKASKAFHRSWKLALLVTVEYCLLLVAENKNKNENENIIKADCIRNAAARQIAKLYCYIVQCSGVIFSTVQWSNV